MTARRQTLARACARCGSARVWAGNLCWSCHRTRSAEIRESSQHGQARYERAIVFAILSFGGGAAIAQFSVAAAAVSPIVFAIAAHALGRRHARAQELAVMPQARLLPPRS